MEGESASAKIIKDISSDDDSNDDNLPIAKNTDTEGRLKDMVIS